jgi:hypothetical protein
MAAELDPYDMSDEELEAAFREAKSQEDEAPVEEESSGEEEIIEEEVEETDDDVEEEIDEELEQPVDDEDSDDDASLDDEEEDESEEDAEETEEDTPDGETDEDEAETTEDEEESEKEEQPVQTTEKLAFKANGRDYEFTVDEMKQQFGRVFGQAMDYTKKMQAIKPYRKRLDALEQAEISDEDLNLMIDVLKGDKGALTEVVKRTGIDTLDLDTEGESKYVAKDYGRDDTTLAIKDVIDEISADEEYSITHKVLSSDWDESSWEEMTKDPELIRLLHVDVKSGMYDKVQPIADKLKLFNRGGKKTDLEYYKEAAGIYFQEEAQEKAKAEAAEQARMEAEKAEEARLKEVKTKQAKQKTVKKEAIKRKAAAPTKKGSGTKQHTNYLDDSDEAFEEWYKNLQDSQ